MNDLTATDVLAERALRSAKAYWNEVRFHAIVDSAVARIMQDHGPINPERADREACDIALRVAALVLQTVYEDDAELRNLKAQTAEYRQIAEGALNAAPMRFPVPKKD